MEVSLLTAPPQRARLAVLLALVAAALALPAAAHADFKDNTICRGHISKGPADPLGINENPVAYRFACSAPLTGYAIVSDKEIDTFETEVFVHEMNNGPVAPTDAFSCNGDLPGFGINCVGTYSASWRVVESTFNLSAPVCDEQRIDPLLVVTYATYVRDAKGKPAFNKDGTPQLTTAVAGPFDLGRPRGCKPSKFSGKTRIPKDDATPARATRRQR